MLHSAGMDTEMDRKQFAVPLGIKRLIQSAITHPIVGWVISRYFGEKIPNWDCKIYAPSPDLSLRTIAKIYWRFYEKSEVLFVKKYLRSNLDVVELGSSIGIVSSHIGKNLKPGRRLVCVEANPGLIPLLKRNLDLNAQQVQCVVVNAAIDYSGSQQVPLYISNTNTDSSLANRSNDYVCVNALTLSELIRMYEIDEFALICDIEGSEYGILKHETATLEKCKQLIIELHVCQENARMISIEQMKSSLVTTHGFKLRLSRGNVFLFER